MINKTAVFLDRDGTIIQDRGHLSDPSEVVFFEKTFDSLKKLQTHFRLFIVTNQSGISQGIVSRPEVDAVNRHILGACEENNIHIADLYVCPHTKEDECACRKPLPFFPEKAAEEYGIDLAGSFSMGDHPCDYELAQNVGGHGVYVLTGHGKKHESELPSEAPVFSGIQQAADWIMSTIPADS